MKTTGRGWTRIGGWALASLALLVLAGCAAGSESEWAAEGAEPAGFFAGLWHGVLLLVTLVVSFFTDEVSIYEIHNSGIGYNIGFVLGILAVYGNGLHLKVVRRGKPSPEFSGDPDDIAERVEKRIRDEFTRWLKKTEEFEGLGEKVQRKVKERMRSWLEEDARKNRVDPEDE